MRERHINPRSKLNEQKRRLAERYGEFYHDGDPWTPADDDILLDGFLVHGWIASGRPPSFHSEMGRSPKSIWTRLWKLPARYPDVAGYVSTNRINRAGEPFSKRELDLLALCFGEAGQKNGAYKLSWIAKLTSRSKQEIHAWMQRTLNTAAGPFSRHDKTELTDLEIARRLSHLLNSAGALKRLILSLGQEEHCENRT